MSWLESARRQLHIRHVILMLSAGTEAERHQAFLYLRQHGTTCRPQLQKLLTGSSYLARCSAAVLLHKLGDPAGLSALKDLIQDLPALPSIAAPLESAWLQIGSEDGVPALLEVWHQLSGKTDQKAIYASICLLWNRFRDPRVLSTLTKDALRVPETFPETIAAFGLEALPYLESMLKDADVNRRWLALRVFHFFPNWWTHREPIEELLFPLLHDPAPDIRNDVLLLLPHYRDKYVVAQAALNALHSGFSTRESVILLHSHQPAHYGESLIALLNRWNPTATCSVERPFVLHRMELKAALDKPEFFQSGGDTEAAIIEAISTLAMARHFEYKLRPALYGLLNRNPSSSLLCSIARAFRSQSLPPMEQEQAQTVLWSMLSHANTEVRKAAATTLEFAGAALPPAFVQWLTLSGNWQKRYPMRDELEGQDFPDISGWRQRGAWMIKTGSHTGYPVDARWLSADLFDAEPRLPQLLADLLSNSLRLLADVPDRLTDTERLSLIGSLLSQSENGLLALLLLPPKQPILTVRDAAVSAMHTKVRIPTYIGGEPVELCRRIRGYAAAALRHYYGPNVFPLFVEALYSDSFYVQRTAISALGELGDARALPLLEPFTDPPLRAEPVTSSPAPSATLARLASEAIAKIRKSHPEIMTLLRGSQRQANASDTLLRPATASKNKQAKNICCVPSKPNHSDQAL